MKDGTLHINIPLNTVYYAMVRKKGYRKWSSAGPERKKKEDAIMDMARKFSEGGWKRGVVMRKSEFYDPEIVVELEE